MTTILFAHDSVGWWFGLGSTGATDMATISWPIKKKELQTGKHQWGFKPLCHLHWQLIAQIKSHSQSTVVGWRGNLLLKCQCKVISLRPSSRCSGHLHEQSTEAPRYWGALDPSSTLCYWGFLSGYHAWLCKPLDVPSSPSPSHDHRD